MLIVSRIYNIIYINFLLVVSILFPLPSIPSVNVKLIIFTHTHIKHIFASSQGDYDYEMSDDDDWGGGEELQTREWFIW